MDTLVALLTDYGYLGFFIASFIAGSVFPFSSEAVMVGLMAAGLDTTGLVVYGTAGNALGSMFNYCVGRLGKPEWIERYLHVSNESLKKAQRFMAGRGAWMGFFTFLPILGSAIAIASNHGIFAIGLKIHIICILVERCSCVMDRCTKPVNLPVEHSQSGHAERKQEVSFEDFILKMGLDHKVEDQLGGSRCRCHIVVSVDSIGNLHHRPGLSNRHCQKLRWQPG